MCPILLDTEVYFLKKVGMYILHYFHDKERAVDRKNQNILEGPMYKTTFTT